jgi:hypothetical protein
MDPPGVVAGVLPGFRLWVLCLMVEFRRLHLFTKIVTKLERAPGIRSGLLLVITRGIVLDWRGLESQEGLPRIRWLRGQAARDIVLDHILADNVRGPVNTYQ